MQSMDYFTGAVSYIKNIYLSLYFKIKFNSQNKLNESYNILLWNPFTIPKHFHNHIVFKIS